MKLTFRLLFAVLCWLGFALLGGAQSKIPVGSPVPNSTDPKNIALAPQQNEFRNVLSLSGLWNFKIDPENEGEALLWQNGLDGGQPIAVPGSWNEQISGLKDYMGRTWYETKVTIPHSWKGERIFLRVGGAAYASKVFVNGQEAGTHQGGSLPYALEINSFLKIGQENLISITVENELAPTRIPTGNLGGSAQSSSQYPATTYDFFPYGGLQRDVMLCTIPSSASLQDVTIVPSFEGSTGYLDLYVEYTGKASKAVASVSAPGKETISTGVSLSSGHALIELPDVELWSMDNPFLYNVKVELFQGGKAVDCYSCNTGVRTVSVDGSQILLNGEPVQLRGFGKHEDFPIFGRGKALPVTVKDFELMKWCGANSFRTSHYPYDETVYEIADRLGILIIDEMPSVGLLFHDGDENVAIRKAVCDQMLEEMINRDKNHPSVIMWSVANEPTSASKNKTRGMEVLEETEDNRIGREFLAALMDQVRAKDPSRPVTFASMGGTPYNWCAACDVVCINRYFGWYSFVGHMEEALERFASELDEFNETFCKPVIVTEFGTDTVPGEHSEYRELFSEEFQSDFIESYLDIAAQRPFVSGMMVWNFADFHTGQSIRRVGSMNLKGVFTVDRRPKMAAYLLHERWFDKKGY